MKNSSKKLMKPIVDRNDILEMENVQYAERGVANSTYKILKNSANQFGERTALTFLKKGVVTDEALNVSYQELLFNITQTANLFHRYDVGREDVVSLLLPNVPEMHYAVWGAQVVGICNPINPHLKAETICDILNAVGSKVLVTLGDENGRDVWQKVLAIADKVPTLRYILVVTLDGHLVKNDVTSRGVKIRDFSKLREQEEGMNFRGGTLPEANDISAYFHTGGTTGVPKVACLNHSNQTFMAFSISKMLKLTADDRVMGGLPLFHVNAVYSAGLANFLVGANVIMLGADGFRHKASVQDFWKTVAKYQATWVSGVPTFYSSLLAIPIEGQNISSLRLGVMGAAPSSPEMFKQFSNFPGLNVVEGYGLTEGTCLSTVNPIDGEKRIGSIGMSIPYQETKAVMLNDKGQIARDCEVDEIGVLVIRGPNVFQGYLDVSKNTGVLLEGGWLNTGDLGKCDAQGYFWLTGRAKDLIIRGGHNIDPKMIEDVLARHPAIALVAAIGQLDSYAGELPAAYITLKENITTRVEDIMEFARKNIGERAAIPVNIEILEEMPITAVGKIFKPELRRRAIERVLKQALEGAKLKAEINVIHDVAIGTYVKVCSSKDKREVQDLLDQFAVKTIVSY